MESGFKRYKQKCGVERGEKEREGGEMVTEVKKKRKRKGSM